MKRGDRVAKFNCNFFKKKVQTFSKKWSRTANKIGEKNQTLNTNKNGQKRAKPFI